MAKSEFLNSLSALSKKIDALLERNRKMQERIDILEKENFELRQTHIEDIKNLELTKRNEEFLILSHRLAGSPEALKEARMKISGLIRTIDRCIRHIKDEGI